MCRSVTVARSSLPWLNLTNNIFYAQIKMRLVKLKEKKYCAACGEEVDPHASCYYSGQYYHNNTTACSAVVDALVKEDIDSYRRRRRAELMAKNQCFYGIPYSGECCEPADESGFCKEHKGLKCRCGRQATHGSSETTTGFVMGDPLCDEHSQ